jgi:hypothetical protein
VHQEKPFGLGGGGDLLGGSSNVHLQIVANCDASVLPVSRVAACGVVAGLILTACGGTSAASTSTAMPTSSTVAATTTTQAATTSSASSTTTSSPEASAIEIIGDDQFVAQADAALSLLAEETPEIYAEVLTEIDAIESVPEGSGMDVFTKTFRVGDVTAYAPGYEAEDQVVWLAGTIVHDACHSRLYSEGEEYIGRDAELACLQDQLDALLVLSGYAFETYIQSLIDGVDDPANAYWNDPDRHW